MKLIKQNDSAGGLIFKQNVNGKAMKQNYNFGKSFTGLGSIYLECPFLPSYEGDFTFLVRMSSSPRGSGIGYPVFMIRNVDNSQINCAETTSNDKLNGYASSVFNTFEPSKSLGSVLSGNSFPKIIGLRSSNYKSQCIANTSLSGEIDYKSYISSPPLNLYFGIYNYFGIQYQRGNNSEILGYDRYISDSEIAYAYNNGLGNEPLNTNGLKVRLLNNFAEILPYNGGEDEVCIRDVSGNNNHCKFIGLPSGTIEEKLEYANTNLFN